MNKNLLAEEIGGLLQMPEGIPQMRHFILDLAIRGKLMPQNSKDESAAKLLTKIAAEKKKLVRAGKIKPSAALPPIADGEIPFAIPNGWEWVRLGEVAFFNAGKTLDSKRNKGEYKKYLRTVNVRWFRIDFTDLKEMKLEDHELDKYSINNGDVLVLEGGVAGRTAVWDYGKKDIYYQNHIHRVRFMGDINPYYFCYAIYTDFYNNRLSNYSAGITIKSISSKRLSKYSFPLPPLAEQKRIVAKVNQLMACCDKLEEAQKIEEGCRERFLDSVLQELTDTSKSFGKSADFALSHFSRLTLRAKDIKVWRKSILDMAVRGKLVPQNSKDESAAKLLVKIAAEKKKLVRAGKIKPSAVLPPIADDEIPFAIPNGWEWVRLSDVGIVNPRNKVEDEDDSSFVPMKLIFAEYGKLHQSESRPWKEIKNGFTHFSKNDVGVAKITPCFENGKSTIFQKTGAGTTELYIIRPIYVLPHYALIFLKSPLFIHKGISKMTGTAGQKRLPKSYFISCPCPMPPLAEQKRIVAKVKELMACCDKLEAELSAAEDYRRRLARTLLVI